MLSLGCFMGLFCGRRGCGERPAAPRPRRSPAGCGFSGLGPALLLVSWCVFARLPADIFSGLLLGPLHRQGPPSSPQTVAGTVVNEGQLPTGARGPGVWGGVQAGSLCRVRLWEMRAFPADRGPPGLSSGGDFVSFPAPPPKGTPRLSPAPGAPRGGRRTFSSQLGFC